VICFWRASANRDTYGSRIVAERAAGEFADLGNQPLDRFACAEMAQRLKRLDQAVITELYLVRALGFRNTVSDLDEGVPQRTLRALSPP